MAWVSRKWGTKGSIMALTITIAELAVALRIITSPSGGVPEPHLGILTRLREVAERKIERYAPEASEATKNEAAVRLVGYLFEAPPVNPSRNVSTPEGAFRNSGAKELLSDSHVLGTVKV